MTPVMPQSAAPCAAVRPWASAALMSAPAAISSRIVSIASASVLRRPVRSDSLVPTLAAVLAGHCKASYAGDSLYKPVSTTAPLLLLG